MLISPCYDYIFAYEEIHTPFPLMQKLQSRLGYLLCNPDSSLTHSYSEAHFNWLKMVEITFVGLANVLR